VHGTFLGEREVVGIAPRPQFGRQQRAAESTLVHPLFRDEQRHDGVTVAAVASLPLRHHRQEPRVEPVGPLRLVACGHGGGEGADVVAAVPFARAEEVVVDRVEAADARGMDIVLHVVVRQLQTRKQQVSGEGVDDLSCDRHPRCHPCVVGAVLGVAHDDIMPEDIAALQAADDLLHGGLLRGLWRDGAT